MAIQKASMPKLSVNKLCEYTGAKATRQRQILRDQKFPGPFKGMFYREATEAITACLASSLEDLEPLSRAVRQLEQMPAEKVGTQRRISANLDAIEAFQSMLDEISLDGVTPTLAANSAPLLQFQNVQISVRPEILLTAPGKKTGALIGSIKLHFSRSFCLDGETSGLVSAVLQEWHRTHQPNEGMPSGSMCYVIDVGTKRVWPGVKSTTARMKEVTSQCQNIAALWPTITEKD